MNERKNNEQTKVNKDYYFPVILSQLLCCAGVVAVFFFARTTEAWNEVSNVYTRLLEEDFLTAEFSSVVSGMKEYLLEGSHSFAVFNNRVEPYAEQNTAETTTAAENTSEAEKTEAYEETVPGFVTDETTEPMTSEVAQPSVMTASLSANGKKELAAPLKLSYKRSQEIISPVYGGRYTSYFGERTDPITEGSDYHKGLDIGADEGDRIRAVYDGEVLSTGEDSRSGKYVFLQHEDGVVTFYCHCSKVLCDEGESVNQGDTIALVGSTGYSTGPHLHFEVRVNGVSVDPLPLLENAA